MNFDSSLKIFLFVIVAVYFGSILMFDVYTVYAVSMVLLATLAIPFLLFWSIKLFLQKPEKHQQ